MTDYAAPVRDMSFVIEELIGLETINTLPGLDWVTGDLVRAVLTEAGKFGAEVLAPLNRVGDMQGCELKNGVVTTPDGFADAYRQFTAGRLERPHRDPRIWRPGHALAGHDRARGDLGIGQSRLQPVPDADPERDLGALDPRLARTEGHLASQAGERRMGGDDEPHRAACRFGCRRAQDPRRARGRPLPDYRPEDLHHLGRTRHGREHRPYGAGQDRRRAGGNARRSRCSSSPNTRSTRTARSGRATICAAPRWSTSSASMRAPPR